MTKSISSGKFITFEGVDGCGKSTQAEKLVEKLFEVKISAIRKILLHAEESMSDRAEALLMIASRAQLTDKVILPHIINGKWVVADRYADSTLAYQGGGRGLSIKALEEINSFGTYTLKPDVTFFIDVPIEKADERMSVSRDRIEKEGSNFQQRVRDQYLAMNVKEPERVILINGEQSIDKVFEQIWSIMQEKFNL
jgi:dTMP kinase